jgi:3-phosphoshikimate 1-carboxyvinyltransferase
MTVVAPAASLRGALAMPGDKSISHRALLLGAVSNGEVAIAGFGRSADTESTIAALRSLGVEVREDGGDALGVRGAGLQGLCEPAEPIDCGNAGTLARLLAGILAGHAGRRFELTGDESLRARPMDRVAEPLTQLGAVVETRDGCLPMRIEGRPLRGITYATPVASAQVKSCVLLAGLYADGRTAVVEQSATRDHTERMLRAAGVRLRRTGLRTSVWPVERVALERVDVPGDFSSAAPFIVAATLLSGSDLIVSGVGINPGRIGFLHVLERMGARISIFNRRMLGGEPTADLSVLHAELVATEIGSSEVASLVDELPLFALAASMARGESRVRGALELREKETDRLDAVITGLRALEVRVSATPDGFRVRGVPSRPRGGTLDSRGDHRIAILGAVAGLVSRDGVTVEGAEAVAVSFPGFFDLLESVAQR